VETGRLADGGRFSASSRQRRRAPAVISLGELRDSALVRNLIRLADGRRFSSSFWDGEPRVEDLAG